MLDASVLRSLDVLYGLQSGREEAACAVGTQLELLWSNCDAAQSMLIALKGAVMGSPRLAEQLIGDSGNVTFAYEGETCTCRRLRMRDAAGEAFWLLLFGKQQGRHGLCYSELRQLLGQHAQAIDRIVFEIESALTAGAVAEHAPETAGQIRSTCAELLNLAQRESCLLWYEDAAGCGPSDFSPVDINAVAQMLTEEIAAAAGDAMKVKYLTQTEHCYARVDCEQFCCAVLSMLITAQRGNPQLTGLTVSVGNAQKADRVCVSVGLTAAEGTDLSRLRSYTADGTACGEQLLLDRFCETFGAEMTASVREESALYSLTLPAVPMQFAGKAEERPGSETELRLSLHTVTRSLLSAILRQSCG